MDESVIKHLYMLQEIINRMASNSFKLKGWAVTLVAGIFALSSRDSDLIFFLVIYIPIIVFWILDSFYLQQERKFRIIYDVIRKNKDTDFSMKWDNSWKTQKTNWFNCLVSFSEIMFYLPLALLSTIIVLFKLW